MAILEGVEIWFAKVNPKRPSAKFNKKNPTWECQIRTTSKEKKKEWENINLNVKAIIPDEEGMLPFWRCNLRKKSLKEDGTPSSFVKVIDGDFNEVDPDTIGNGSIGNVRIFQYEYSKQEGGKGVASVLMGIQLTKHIMYTPKPYDDDFKKTETVVIAEEKEESSVEKDYGDEVPKEKEETPSPSPSPTVKEAF